MHTALYHVIIYRVVSREFIIIKKCLARSNIDYVQSVKMPVNA